MTSATDPINGYLASSFEKIRAWTIRQFSQHMQQDGGGLELTASHAPRDVIGQYSLMPNRDDLDVVVTELLSDAQQDSDAHGAGAWTYYIHAFRNPPSEQAQVGPLIAQRPIARFSFTLSNYSFDAQTNTLTSPTPENTAPRLPETESQVQQADRRFENYLKIELAGRAAKEEGWVQLVRAQMEAVKQFQAIQETYLGAVRQVADRQEEIERQREFEREESEKNRQIGSKALEVVKLVLLHRLAKSQMAAQQQGPQPGDPMWPGN